MPAYGTTVRNKLRALLGTNKVSDVDAGLLALAEDVDQKMASYWEGTHAARPGAGQANRFYKETDTGLLFHDTGAAWEQLLRAGDQTFPQSFFTGLVGVGEVVGGSEHTINLRAGALVEFMALLHWTGSSDQFVAMRLLRDGVVVDEIQPHGVAPGTSTAFLAYAEATGGSHTFVVHIQPFGSNPSYALENGVIKFGT